MNKRTQIILLGLFGGAVGLSLLSKLWLNKSTAQQSAFVELDGLLKLKNPNATRQTFGRELVKEQNDTENQDGYLEEVDEMFEFSEDEIPTTLPNDEFPLRLGSEGARVARLQVWLLRNYGWTGKITGVLDQKTAQQMKRFLKTDALNEATYNYLNLDAPVQQQKSIR
ncbi:MAG: hypothetical protein AAFO82_00065 [Bacteroidota bacterium]